MGLRQTDARSVPRARGQTLSERIAARRTQLALVPAEAGRWRRYVEAQGVTNIGQIKVGHLWTFIIEVQDTPADRKNPSKPT